MCCTYSNELLSLVLSPKLFRIYCSNCPKLNIEDFSNISLHCFIQCRNTSIFNINIRTHCLNIIGSKWLTICGQLHTKIDLNKIEFIQKEIKNTKLRRFLKLVKSRSFNEYFYSPESYGPKGTFEGIGGLWVKRELESMFK